MNYYNENDPKAAAWLSELIKAGLIPDGIVDTRSITDVKASDLTGFNQCHFFAGIGGWAYALELARWPADRPVWTGSCPCQPFSTAQQHKKTGFADERHLWPAFFHLICECKPPVVFGEQVASPAGLAWLDAVFTDLEDADYARGAADLCAAGVGAPHIRQRLYWVAVADRKRREGARLQLQPRESRLSGLEAWWSSQDVSVGNARSTGSGWDSIAIPGPKSATRWGVRRESDVVEFTSSDLGVANAHGAGSQGRGERGVGADQRAARPAGVDSPWANSEWILCNDPNGPRWRPIEPGTQPLAHGVPDRVGLLRGYGNAIVPQVAAEFIRAALS